MPQSPLARRPVGELAAVQGESRDSLGGTSSTAGGVAYKGVTELPGVERLGGALPDLDRGSRSSEVRGQKLQPLGGLGRPLGLTTKSPGSPGSAAQRVGKGHHFGATHPLPRTRQTGVPAPLSKHMPPTRSTQPPTEVSSKLEFSKARRHTEQANRTGGFGISSSQRGEPLDPSEQMEPSVAAAEAIMNSDRVQLGNLLRNQHITTTTLIGDHAMIAWAAEQCRPEMCRVLLESCADVDATDAAGRSALALGAGAGDVQVLELLIEYQAQVAKKDLSGHRPLHWAAYGGSDEACALLLTSKAVPNEVDDAGQTPLHTAARFGHSEVCELLLRQKAEANAADQQGQAPLHLATLWGFPHICAVLLQSGADRNLQRKDGAAATHLSKMPWI